MTSQSRHCDLTRRPRALLRAQDCSSYLKGEEWKKRKKGKKRKHTVALLLAGGTILFTEDPYYCNRVVLFVGSVTYCCNRLLAPILPLRRLSSFSTQPATRVLRLTCCKRMFKVFQIFQKYVASVSYGCCKSRSECCICWNGYTHMLQTSVPNVSSVF
jgi:hypothetical protein